MTEIDNFFADNKIPLKNIVMVGVRRHGLPAPAIREAAESIYNDVQAGRQIDPIRLAWEVYALAKQLKAAGIVSEKEKIAALERELAYYKLPWWRRIWGAK